MPHGMPKAMANSTDGMPMPPGVERKKGGSLVIDTVI